MKKCANMDEAAAAWEIAVTRIGAKTTRQNGELCLGTFVGVDVKSGNRVQCEALSIRGRTHAEIGGHANWGGGHEN